MSGVFFFGNKTITTGEGGAVITMDEDLAARLRIAKNQGQNPSQRYWHDVMGFNYRMTNVAAALGLAQSERLSYFIERKRLIARQYRQLLASLPITFQRLADDVSSSNWLVSVLLPRGCDRNQLMEDMRLAGVDTRPVSSVPIACPCI